MRQMSTRCTLELTTTFLVTILSQSAFGDYSTGNNAMFIDLTEDESTPGTYKLDYTILNGTVLSGGIIDDCGEYLAKYVYILLLECPVKRDSDHLRSLSSISTGSASSVTVGLGEDYGDITFLGWIKDSG